MSIDLNNLLRREINGETYIIITLSQYYELISIMRERETFADRINRNISLLDKGELPLSLLDGDESFKTEDAERATEILKSAKVILTPEEERNLGGPFKADILAKKIPSTTSLKNEGIEGTINLTNSSDEKLDDVKVCKKSIELFRYNGSVNFDKWFKLQGNPRKIVLTYEEYLQLVEERKSQFSPDEFDDIMVILTKDEEAKTREKNLNNVPMHGIYTGYLVNLLNRGEKAYLEEMSEGLIEFTRTLIRFAMKDIAIDTMGKVSLEELCREREILDNALEEMRGRN